MSNFAVIGITGIAGAGKSILTKTLSNEFKATDLYWDDFDSISKSPTDLVEWFKKSRDYKAWDYPGLANVLKSLKSGKTIQHPILHKNLLSTRFIIFDAPLGRLHKQTGQYIDFEIYMDTPLDVALCRRILRDFANTNQNKKELLEELKFYLEKSRPLYISDDLKQSADFIMDGLMDIQEQVKIIGEQLQSRGW